MARMPRRAAILLGLALVVTGCRGGGSFKGPHALLRDSPLEEKTARTGALTTGGETRPALLASARYRVPLPRRPLLTPSRLAFVGFAAICSALSKGQRLAGGK